MNQSWPECVHRNKLPFKRKCDKNMKLPYREINKRNHFLCLKKMQSLRSHAEIEKIFSIKIKKMPKMQWSFKKWAMLKMKKEIPQSFVRC